MSSAAHRFCATSPAAGWIAPSIARSPTAPRLRPRRLAHLAAPADQPGNAAGEIARSAVAVRHLIRPSIWVRAGRARDDVTTSCGDHRPPG